MQEEYARQLRRERERHSWSQEQVAEQLGTTAPNVSRWERGKTFPDTYYRQKLCELFGKSAEELGLLQNDAAEKREQLPNQRAVTHDPNAPVQGAFLSRRNRNRQRMLEKVRTFWITGVLEQSLYGAALITLGLHEQPDAVAHPWELVLQQSDQSAHPLPPGTRITQVYDTMGGELLILGEPGSGKTTLLLELARDLLDRAMQDETLPMPVVFNLSSWAMERQSLADWLAEELHEKYQVPHKLAREWVDADQVLPLLDGLDEVTPSARMACIEAINAYRREHGLSPTVVCCRSTEYATLKMRLLLQLAVVVQPLTLQQIETYLLLVGEQVTTLRAALQVDPLLQELAATPLMLSVLILAYHGKSVEDLLEAESLETQRRQVFATYVKRMLQRRGVTTFYTPAHMLHWLSWLAKQLTKQNQTEFYVEHLQPTWLSGERMRRAYDRWALRVPAALIGILVCLVISTFFGDFIFISGFFFVISNIIPYGCIGWLLGTACTAQQLHQSSEMARRGIWSRLREWLFPGILVGLSFGQLWGVSWEPRIGLNYFLSFGLGGILLRALLRQSNRATSNLQVAQRPRKLKYQHLMRSVGVRNGILVGLILWLSYVLGRLLTYYVLNYGMDDEMTSSELIVNLGGLWSLSFALIGAFISMLVVGEPVGVTLTDKLVWSWRSLRRSLFAKRHLKSTMCVMALIALSTGLSTGLAYGLLAGLVYGLRNGLLVGLSLWLLLGLFQGVSSETIGNQHRVIPNQGIRHSARNSLVLGLIGTGIVWLFSPLILDLSFQVEFWMHFWLSADDLVPVLILGLSAGLLTGLLSGGLACVRHYMLHFLLWRAHSIPWNYPRFLDAVAERILLRKVGGGYIFIHRLLLEYFASLDDEQISNENFLLKPQVYSLVGS